MILLQLFFKGNDGTERKKDFSLKINLGGRFETVDRTKSFEDNI